VDRADSPAMQVLAKKRAVMRVFQAIERAIGDGSSAALSHTTLMYEYHLGHIAIRKSLPLLVELGLIEIDRGRHNVNVFRFSNRWRTVTAEAAQMAVLAQAP
jgi:DNA-binding GntR family transcriptional regulator